MVGEEGQREGCVFELRVCGTMCLQKRSWGLGGEMVMYETARAFPGGLDALRPRCQVCVTAEMPAPLSRASQPAPWPIPAAFARVTSCRRPVSTRERNEL